MSEEKRPRRRYRTTEEPIVLRRPIAVSLSDEQRARAVNLLAQLLKDLVDAERRASADGPDAGLIDP